MMLGVLLCGSNIDYVCRELVLGHLVTCRHFTSTEHTVVHLRIHMIRFYGAKQTVKPGVGVELV